MIILGIDPGLADVGYGVIDVQGQKLKCLDYGVIKTSSKKELAERLLEINTELKKVIKKHKPEVMGVEEIYFCKNVSSAIKVGQAKGAIIACCGEKGMRVREFTPLQIKETVTGYGRGDKRQVQQMVKLLLNLKTLPKPDHAADALGAAITCSRYEKII